MKNTMRAVAFLTVTAMILCIGTAVISTVDAENVDLSSAINAMDKNETVLELDSTNTYYLTSGTITKTNLEIDGNGATLILSANTEFNANYKTGIVPSLWIHDLNIEATASSQSMFSFSLYNWTELTIGDCDFSNVKLFTGGTTNEDESHYSLRNCNFIGTLTDTGYAVTLNSGNVMVSGNTVDGYGRGINMNLSNGQDGILIKDNTIRNLEHESKPVAFQICEDTGGRTVTLVGNTVNSGIGVSIYHNLITGDSSVELINNTFTNCDYDILYSSDNDGYNQNYDTPVTILGTAFIHYGVNTDPIFASEIPRTDTSGTVVGVIPSDDKTAIEDSVSSASYTWYTPGKPMTLEDENQLLEFALLVNSGVDFKNEVVNLVTGRTYDISGSQWTPIGITIGNTDRPFSGTFDGNCATISGLTMTSDSISYYNGMDSGDYYAYGFFGGVVNGNVTDIRFVDFNIETPGMDSQNNVVAVAVGALLFNGEVSNITVGDLDDTLTAISRGSGIVGYIGGAKTGNEAPANQDGTAVIGTITISDNVNYADIASNWTDTSHGTAAGIVSTNNAKSMHGGVYIISGNQNYGDIEGYFAAGIMASDFSNDTVTSITGNTNHGNISTTAEASGVVALGISAVKNSNTTGTATTVSGNTNNGSVISEHGTASGIVGTIYEGAEIENNINNGTISGYYIASGIVSTASGGDIKANTNAGTVSISCSESVISIGNNYYSTAAGGIVAHMSGGKADFSDSTHTGIVTGPTSIDNIGTAIGLANRGHINGLSDDTEIGAIQTLGNNAFTLVLTNVHLDNLVLHPSHNQSFIYTLDLNDSEIGAITGSGDVHTGMNLRIEGGSVGTLDLDLSGHFDSDTETYSGTTLTLLLESANIGTVKAYTTDYNVRVAIDASSSIQDLVLDGSVSYTTGSLTDTDSTNTYTNLGKIDNIIYDGSSAEILNRFLSTGDPGYMNALTGQSFSILIGDSDSIALSTGIRVIIQSGETLKLSANVTSGTIIGTDKTSKLVTDDDGLYGNLAAQTYTWIDEGQGSTWSAPGVAVIDGFATEYQSVAAAISDAKNGDTVRLVGDSYEVETVTISNITITIDMDGHTLTFGQIGGSSYGLVINNGASLTLTDGTVVLPTNGTGIEIPHGHLTVDCTVIGTGIFTLDNGDPAGMNIIRIHGSLDDVADYSSVTVTRNGVIDYQPAQNVVEGAYALTITDPDDDAVSYGASVVVQGKIVGMMETAIYVDGTITTGGTNIPVVDVQSGSELSGNIYGAGVADYIISGKMDGSNTNVGVGAEIRGGAVTVNEGAEIIGGNGVFSMKPLGNGFTAKNAALVISPHTYGQESMLFTVKGGTFTGTMSIVYRDVQDTNTRPSLVGSTVTDGRFNGEVDFDNGLKPISGGVFSVDVSSFCANGYASTENPDGTYSVDEAMEPDVTITQAGDLTVGGTITLTVNVVGTGWSPTYLWGDGQITQSITVDSPGTYSVKVTVSGFGIEHEYNLSITVSIESNTVTVEFPEFTGIPDAVLSVLDGDRVETDDVEVPEGYTVLGFTYDGEDFSGTVSDDMILQASMGLSKPQVKVAGIIHHEGYSDLTISASHPLDGVMFMFYLYDGSDKPLTYNVTGVFTITISGTYSIGVLAILDFEDGSLTSSSTVSNVSIVVEATPGYVFDIQHTGDTASAVVDDTARFESSDQHENVNIDVTFIGTTTISILGTTEPGTVTVSAREIPSTSIPISMPSTTVGIDVSVNNMTIIGMEIAFEITVPNGYAISDAEAFYLDATGKQVAANGYRIDENTVYVQTTHNTPYYVTPTFTEVTEPDTPPLPSWDDDDDYVPIIPVVPEQSSSGDDTVKIVACAAAAVVAAILAVFLIVERKH